MNDAQETIYRLVGQRLGEAAAAELLDGWRAAGVLDRPAPAPSRAELPRLMAWRLSPYASRRKVAMARLAKLGLEVAITKSQP